MSGFLSLQLPFALAGVGVIIKAFEMNKLPRSIASGPVGNSLVVLVGAALRIFANAGIKATSRRAPKDIDEIGFASNSRHGADPARKATTGDSRGWLRGLDLNQRPLGYEPNELPDCSTPHWQYSEST